MLIIALIPCENCKHKEEKEEEKKKTQAKVSLTKGLRKRLHKKLYKKLYVGQQEGLIDYSTLIDNKK